MLIVAVQSRMQEAAIVLPLLLVAVLGAGITVWLVVRATKRWKTASVSLKIAACAVGLSAVVGALGTVIGLIKAFGAVGGQSVDPSQKARILAEGISVAMNCAVLGFIIWIPGVVVTIIVMCRSRSGNTKSGPDDSALMKP